MNYNIYAIVGTYLILLCGGGTRLSVFVSFVFNLGFLLTGFFFTQPEVYQVSWTTPHCVLTLRLIGLTFDLYDGERARREGRQALSREQEETLLEETPSLLEILSHSFFLGGYFVGPPIAMKKYLQSVSPTYQASLPDSPLLYGFQRLGLGVLYLLLHLLGSLLLPNDWPASQHFSSILLVTKLLLLPAWAKFLLAKYLSVWLMAEGVCVISGISYTGTREDGTPDWSGCANVKLRRLESASKFHHVVESFNVLTNHWASVYIYKRLKFLGSRTLSLLLTLIFLAVWHGCHSGYYLAFINEFLLVKVEREFLSICGRSKKVERWLESPRLARLFRLLGWLVVLFFLPLCFIPFALLTFSKFYPAYAATYFLLYVVFGSWPLIRGLLKWFLFDENVPEENIPGEDVPEENVPGENVPNEDVPEENVFNENVPEENVDKKND